MFELIKAYSYGLLYVLFPAILLLIFGLSIYSLYESFDVLKCFIYAVLWSFEVIVFWLCYLLMKALEAIREEDE